MKFNQQLSIAFFQRNNSSAAPSPSPGFKLRRPLPLTLPPESTVLHHAGTTTGGTRWNPTEEQIRILESLYSSGMRTPNAQQIERITSELVGHGRIEGKNVFYWFQNHKARERQKQKRSAAGLPHLRHSFLDKDDPSPPPTNFIFSDTKEAEEEGRLKRRRSRSLEELEMDITGRRTLHLFPLQPENINGSQMRRMQHFDEIDT